MLHKAYNKISQTYHKNLSGEIYSATANIALDQISEHRQEMTNIIDFGMGNGAFLSKLNTIYTAAHLNGIDISAKMIAEASKVNKALTAHNIPLQEVSQYFNQHSMDLVVAHFLSAYTGLDCILDKAKYLLSDAGLLSFSVMPKDTFSNTQQQLATMKRALHPYKRIFSNIGLKMHSHSLTPENFEAIVKQANKANFYVCERKRLEFVCEFNNVDDFYELMVNGSWLINDNKWIQGILLRKSLSKHIGNQLFKFPFVDKAVVEVVLLRLNKK